MPASLRRVLIAALLAVSPMQAAETPQRNSDFGTTLELKLEPLSGSAVREGEAARVTLTLRNESSGTPLGGVFPNAWFHLRNDDEPIDRHQCTGIIAAYAGENTLTRPALDLNIYYVIALNGDGTLTVVDPVFGFGGTQLLAMLQLDSPGFDWTLAGADNRLFVTMPASGHVAVIDTTRWKLLKTIDAGAEPRRIAAQHDGHYVWIAAAAGVSAVRTSDLSVAATIATGKGAHDLAITPDDRTVFVTNTDGTVALIDVAKLAIAAREPAGAQPVSVAWSELSGLAYVTSTDGAITALEPRTGKIVAHIETEAGLERIRFAPGGRYGFALNPSKDLLHIIDVASNRVVQTGELEGGPFEVTFTDSLAYIRRRASELVLMVPLPNIGKEGTQLSVAEFPGGDETFGKHARTTVADGIVAAPGADAVLVANPADQHVYFYKEGMAAPSGYFKNYGHDPQAVMVLDRSLAERAPGSFSTIATMPPAGIYDVAVFVGSPRVISCFRVHVAENPAIPKPLPPLRVEHLTRQDGITAGKPAEIEVRLTIPATGKPAAALDDAGVLIVQAGGTWSDRQRLTPIGDGRYTAAFTPPLRGVYYVYVECRSAGLRASNPQFLVLQAQ
jgi:hypothetical protein